GFAIWPFMAAGRATVVEIYPRVLTGEVIKTNAVERATFLDRWPDLPSALRGIAAAGDDAFDAAVSALVMWAHREDLRTLRAPRGETDRLEGAIWAPSCAQTNTTCARPGCWRTSPSARRSDWRRHVDALLGRPAAERRAA